jgi:hypothetical protein
MFAYPPQAAVLRPVPKNKLYGHARPSRAVRESFVSEVREIVWKYKLAPETVNLPAKPPVQEIQIFELTLKGEDYSEDVLRALDKAIPSLLFFEIRSAERVQFAAAYKRPNEADASKNVIDAYFATPWQPVEQERPALPLALDLAALYERMLQEHMKASPMALTPRRDESLHAMAERARLIQMKEKECRRLQAQMDREIQFNRKVELNGQLRRMRSELHALHQ